MKWLFRLDCIIGFGLTALVVAIGIVGPLIIPHSPYSTSLRNALAPPSSTHLFGTDEAGRDLFSRVIVGTRYSVSSGFFIVLLAAIIGVPLGLVAGYFGSWFETLIMRIVDVFLGIPALILALAVVMAVGPGFLNGLIAASAVWWMGFARLVRGEVLGAKAQPFVEAARALGASHVRIISRHILPRCLGPLLVKTSMDIGYAILFMAGLGFLGVGVQPPQPEWGTMLATGREYVISAWWVPTFPGLALFVSATAFNVMGETLHDVVLPSKRD